ncbi:ABC transporter ATP-binding protein [Aureliella helgolandensis]|uniref:Lipid A export ATP-binding/permease protein MsbA n=1 Tax=Aureliella helgolandensis TaxID=2527968 RepID=A0A518G4J8_9BACT|nr:ABC transporter ATP-binding protein [Aureliella helgolandensis]QDV23480.1 Lipid A export ATP-binding/permease protein MsbA [Aureliella helgolandensis]
MHNFRRATKEALRYWKTLVLASICSFAIAALWGANVGAFFPILEVTINGKSVHMWMDEETEEARERVESTKASIEQQELALTALPEDSASFTAASTALSGLRSELVAHEAKFLSCQKLDPWVKRFVPSDPFSTIAAIVGVLILSTLVKNVLLITNEVLVGRVALNISRNIRQNIFAKAMGMGRAEFAKHGTSGFTANITHTTEMLSNGLMNTFGAAVREPMKLASCLLGASLICWRLLLMSVVIAPLVGGMLFWITKRLKSIAKGVLAEADGFHSVMLESIGNIHTVQSFRQEEHEKERFGRVTMAMRNVSLKFIFFTSLSKPVIEFLGLGMLGTTIIGGAYLVLNKETSLLGIQICEEQLSVSALLVFFGMLVAASDPLRKMSAIYSSIYAGSMAADALYPLLDQVESIRDPETPQSVTSPHKMLSFKDISFGYTPDQPIIHHVSLNIPFGSTVAIVGHNGSGKSTLIHLLSRFYDPVEGVVELDGVDFRDMLVDDVRKRSALVTQHTELFNKSVAYNIRYGNPHATDEEVERAARQAHAHEFISTVLPEGYETVVGQNGNRLSGGQRQRIALARALLCNPEILILDEATSQIDMKSEQLIRESLSEHRGERTMIIITHREKLLELADEVYEVAEGRLVPRPHLSRNAA